MPSTADELVHAARIVFGQPKDERAVELMTRWLNGCRDWRREATEQQDLVVVSVVFAEAVKAQNLRMQVANNVKRWGFLRRAHAKDHLVFLTVDAYLDGGVGGLVRGRVRKLLDNSFTKAEQTVERKAKGHAEERARRLAAFRQRQREKSLPVLKLYLKGMWDVAGNELRKKLNAQNKSFRDDPVARRRRMGRNVEFDELDDYTEDGEVIWAKRDARAREKARARAAGSL